MATQTLLIGLGKGGTALMPYLMAHPEFDLVAVCDSSPEAVGRFLAERSRVPFYQSPAEAVTTVKPHLVIDATGDPSLPPLLYDVRPAGTSVVTGEASRLLWALLQALEGRRRCEIRHDRLLGDMLAGMLVVQDGRVRFLNPAFLRMTGLEKEQVLGVPYDALLAEDVRERDLEYYRRRMAGAGDVPPEYDTKVLHADGSPREMHVRARLTDFDGRPASLLIMMDVTELRRLQRERERFFRFMVHELRAPLSPMVTAVSLLRQEKVQENPEQVRRLLPLMARSTDRLRQFVDDFLELSRLDTEALRVTQEPVDLKATIEETVEGQCILAEEKGLDLTVEPWEPFEVRGDVFVVRTVTQNLVNNAVKYTDEGGVTVSVEARGERFRLSVRDTGAGLTREEQKNLFQEYGRIQRMEGVKGTGLGLALVKRILDACGGRIEVQSPGKNQGSTFTVTLPRVFGDPDVAKDAPPAGRKAPAGKKA